MEGYMTQYKVLGLPPRPSRTYKDEGWDFNDFFGKKSIPTYEEAKVIVIKNGIRSLEQYYKQYKKLGLPSKPHRTYKDNGWIGSTDFFGKVQFPSYEEAKKIVVENKIRNMVEYMNIYKELGLPANPYNTYKTIGWIDTFDFFGTQKPISSSARKTKVYTTLSISPVLLEDNAPLQIVYMLASQIDKKLASEIEELLNTASCEDRLNMVKEQLKSLKADAESVSVSPRESAIGELSAMESMMEVFEDTMDSLPKYTTEYLNNIIKNYYHNATNRAMIAEYDD